MYKEITSGHTFIQEDGEAIKVYDSIGSITNMEPVYISDFKAQTQKQFEMEVAYILVYNLDRDGMS
jgi:hypothetical protein